MRTGFGIVLVIQEGKRGFLVQVIEISKLEMTLRIGFETVIGGRILHRWGMRTRRGGIIEVALLGIRSARSVLFGQNGGRCVVVSLRALVRAGVAVARLVRH